MDEVQEAAVLETELNALGATPTARQIMDVIAGYSDSAVQIALKRTSGGGGGGEGALQSVAVTMTHADILALGNDTAFQIVAAPAAGKFVLALSVVLVADTTAAPYADIDPSSFIQAGLDDGFSAYPLITVLPEAGGSNISSLLATGAKSIALLGQAAIVPASAGPTALLGWTFGQDPTVYDGQPVSLVMDNGGTPLTGGNAANTLTVTTLYAEIDL